MMDIVLSPSALGIDLQSFLLTDIPHLTLDKPQPLERGVLCRDGQLMRSAGVVRHAGSIAIPHRSTAIERPVAVAVKDNILTT